MPPDEQIAESSTAVVEEAVPPSLSELTDKQYHDWRMTGKMPKADPSPAGSTPAPPADSSQVKKPKAAAENWAELRTKREEAEQRAQRAEAELERLRAGGERKPAESPAAKAAPKLEPPKKPDEKDFTDWQKYQDARDKYLEDFADWKVSVALKAADERRTQEVKDAQVARQNEQIEAKVAKSLEDGKAKYPDFDAVTRGSDGNSKLPITTGSALDGYLLDLVSENGALFVEVMYHLGKNRDECKSINDAPGWKAARMLIALEAKFDTGKPPAKLPIKRVTEASPPARELGNGSGKPPDDPVELSSRHANNPRAYIDEMNRRDIAARRGR